MKLSENNNIDALLKVGGTVFLFFLGKEAISKFKKGGSEADMDTDPSSGQAVGLRQAINPSGFWWMRKFDTTDKEAIFKLASEITDLDSVAKHFKDQTEGSDLYDELQGEISPEDYQKFLSLASKGKTGSYYYAPKSDKVPANKWVITTSDANVRKTARYEWQHAFKNNIVKLVPKGKIIGASTGKFSYDEINKVLFIEFWTLTTKGEKKTYYVAKSQVELISGDEKKKREKQGKIPLEVLEGITGENEIDQIEEPKQEVVTTSVCLVYDESFKQTGIAPKNIILGFPIMTLDTGKGNFIKIRTVQGLVRWIKAELAVVRDRSL